MKNDQVYAHLIINYHAPKWHMAYFVTIDGHFGQIVRYGLKICFVRIYTNFDIQTNFEVN